MSFRQVNCPNWNVTGTGLTHHVAGPGSRRIEDDSADLVFAGGSAAWPVWGLGNYSGGSIRYTTQANAPVSYTYTAAQDHSLYLGTWRTDTAAQITVTIDGTAAAGHNLHLDGEDVPVISSAGEPFPVEFPLHW